MRIRVSAFILLLAGLAWSALPGRRVEPPSEVVSPPRYEPDFEVPSATGSGPAIPDSDRAAPPGSTAETPSGRSGELVFEFSGATPNECAGRALLHRKEGGTTEMTIRGLSLVVPLTEALRRVEFIVEGFAIAEYVGPLAPSEVPVLVPLEPAGGVTVDVVDTSGSVLAQRLVYCYPVQSRADKGAVRHRTTPWSWTDERGRAVIRNVIPGDYRIHTGAVAEWREASVLPVQVVPHLEVNCTLRVPVMKPDEFGGFDIAVADAPFIRINSAGVAGDYEFVSESGYAFKLYRVNGALRCVVPGKIGDTIVGRIRCRSGSSKVERPLHESNGVKVTIGTVLPVVPTWTAVPDPM